MTDARALRERVARALYEAEGGTKWDVLHEGNKDDFRYLADAAIDLVLEEAARVAEKMLRSYTTMDDTPSAIRALKSGK